MIDVDLGLGAGAATVWTCDLTHGYIDDQRRLPVLTVTKVVLGLCRRPDRRRRARASGPAARGQIDGRAVGISRAARSRPGETPEAALIRELHEELGIDTWASCLAPLTFASHSYDDFHLLMPLFACRKWSGTPQPREGQTLAWARANELRDYPMPPPISR